MAIEDWDLNLFTSDPTLLERASDEEYEDTAQRAAVWAGVEQSYAERELAALALSGVVERRDGPGGPAYQPRDGHLIVQLHVALAHGRDRKSTRLNSSHVEISY